MLKFAVKLSVFALIVLGISMFLPGSGKAAADQCPPFNGGFQYAQNQLNWGVNTGGHTGEMAGMIVHAYDGATNTNLTTNYTLNSAIVAAPDPPNQDIGTTDNGATVDLNDRIYDDYKGLPDGFINNPAYRHNTGQGSTNGVNVSSGANGCQGWEAWGPTDPLSNVYTGNGYVLDCGPNNNSHFWFTNLSSNPVGDTGNNGQSGYWSINVSNNDGTILNIAHYIEGSMSYSNSFPVYNGFNTYVNMIWHPTNPPPAQSTNVDATSTCQNVAVDETHTGTGNKTRVWVEVDGPIALGKSKYTDNSNNVTWTPDTNPSGNGNVHYGDPGQPAPPGSVASWVGPGGADGDTGNLSVSKEWWWQPHANSITVTTRTDQLPQTPDGQGGYSYANSSWNNGTPSTTTYNCFIANTCYNPLTVTGDLPGGGVLANGVISVSGTYQNTGLLPLWHPSVFTSDGSSYPVQISGDYLNPGDTAPFSFTIGQAPPGIEVDPVTVTTAYFGAMGTSCTANVPIYQYFHITPTATYQDGTNPENPYEADGTTHGITYNFGGSLDPGDPTITGVTTKGWLTKNGTTVDGVHTTTNDTYGTVSYTDSYADSIQAGNQYCPHVTINPGSGFRGPPGYADIEPEQVSSDGGCLTVVNEPYFKALGSGISASNGVTPTTTVCAANATNSGLLAGWNDNLAYGGTPAERGSGAELSDLALIQITGVASAQTSTGRSAADLTFANNGSPPGSITNHVDSPYLGGNFGGSPTCTNPPPITATSTIGSSASVPSTAGSYQTTGNLTLNGGSVSTTGATSLLVKGDVYITGDITYGSDNPSWTDTNGSFSGPSFTLEATGNIYISNNVKRLDGIYYAQPTDSSHGGSIYTCATGLSPLPATYDFYNNCNNQLLVNGSFVADNVKLLRTFGSLRDEEPTGGAAAVAGTPGTDGASTALNVTTSSSASSDPSCTKITEPSDTAWLAGQLYICVPVADQNQSGYPTNKVTLNWTNTGNRAGDCTASWGSVLRGMQYPAPGTDNGLSPYSPNYPWNDDYLCSNIPITFSTSQTAGDLCTQVPADSPMARTAGWPTVYVCIQAGSPSTSGTPAVSASAPANPACSNNGARTSTSPTNTCAAEIFQLSPEIYMQAPATSNNGATRYDAITDLPPVL